MAFNFKIAGLLAGVAGALAYAFTRKPKQVAAALPPAKPTAADVQVSVAKALASKKPPVMRAVAADLLKKGFIQQAASLDQHATIHEGAAKLSGPTSAAAPAKSDKAIRAAALNTHLLARGRYREDQSMVKAFQAENELTADGKYGVSAALVLSERYGLIPARPFYFSKKTALADKAKFKAAMLEHAAKDPDNAAGWIAASKVDAL
jgi:hypothetical protein